MTTEQTERPATLADLLMIGGWTIVPYYRSVDPITPITGVFALCTRDEWRGSGSDIITHVLADTPEELCTAFVVITDELGGDHVLLIVQMEEARMPTHPSEQRAMIECALAKAVNHWPTHPFKRKLRLRFGDGSHEDVIVSFNPRGNINSNTWIVRTFDMTWQDEWQPASTS